MPRVGAKRFPYTPGGERRAKRYSRVTGQSAQKSEGYGQGMDRRGGARTGMLSRVNRAPGMRPGMNGRPQSPSRSLGQGPSKRGLVQRPSPFGSRGRRPGLRSRSRFGRGKGGGKNVNVLGDPFNYPRY
jgi:hypothetical protein